MECGWWGGGRERGGVQVVESELAIIDKLSLGKSTSSSLLQKKVPGELNPRENENRFIFKDSSIKKKLERTDKEIARTFSATATPPTATPPPGRKQKEDSFCRWCDLFTRVLETRRFQHPLQTNPPIISAGEPVGKHHFSLQIISFYSITEWKWKKKKRRGRELMTRNGTQMLCNLFAGIWRFRTV